MLSDPPRSLPRTRRLTQRREFDEAFKAPRWTNKWFTVYARKNEEGFARLGIMTSKRVMARAVSRNLAKRLVREAFRQEFPANRAVDIVVRTKKAISTADKADGRAALVDLLRSIQV